MELQPAPSPAQDENKNSTEIFNYDPLNRLWQATVVASELPVYVDVQTHVYDDLGNIKNKNGKEYTYTGCNAGPHAVCHAGDDYQQAYGCHRRDVASAPSGWSDLQPRSGYREKSDSAGVRAEGKSLGRAPSHAAPRNMNSNMTMPAIPS